jgi:hypothetical protein
MCLIKDGSFSPIRLFCHKYIETKRKSAIRGSQEPVSFATEQNYFNAIIYKIALCIRSFMYYNKATHKLCFLAKSTESYRVGSHKIERIM